MPFELSLPLVILLIVIGFALLVLLALFGLVILLSIFPPLTSRFDEDFLIGYDDEDNKN